MRAALTWLTAIALLAGAWCVTVLAPSDDAGRDAFVTDIAMGQRAEGRNIAATVLDVRAASAVSAEDGWRAEGNWLIIDITAEAVVSQEKGTLSTATLQIGDRTFSATERGPDEMSIFETQLVPGVPRTGSLLFEVPEDAVHGTGLLRLSPSRNPWGDSVLRLRIDLDAVDRVGDVTVTDVDWTEQ